MAENILVPNGDGIPPEALKITVWFDGSSLTTGITLAPGLKGNWSFVRMVLEESVKITERLIKSHETQQQVAALMQQKAEAEQAQALAEQLRRRR